jgi:endonuclease III
VSDKALRLKKILETVPVSFEPPRAPPGTSLLELGMLCVLQRHVDDERAKKSLAALREGFADWNELRVSQVQEFQRLVPAKDERTRLLAARAVRDYLQEIYQKNHGFDLEPLRQDLIEAGKFVMGLPYLGATASHFLLWSAAGDSVPVSPGVVRTLDRLGIVKRQASIKKSIAAIEKLVPAESRLDFGARVGRVIESWCDAKKPICWECVLVEVCPFGKKTLREWKAQQKRLEVQRKRDEERRAKEAAKEKRRLAAEARKRAAEDARLQKKLEAKRKLEEQKQAREAARQKALAERLRAKKAREDAARQAQKKRLEEAERRATERARKERERKAKAKRPATASPRKRA